MDIRARALEKIILSGEHAIVHGSTTVTASLDLYTQVSLRISNASANLYQISTSFCLETFEGCCTPWKDFHEHYISSPRSCSSKYLKTVASLVEEQYIPEAKIGLASGLSAFIWLYTSIQGYKPATAVVTSGLPLSSGLGSSAAFCVSLSATLLASTYTVSLDQSSQGWVDFKENELELVNKWAYKGERIIHGKPSGIDNTDNQAPLSKSSFHFHNVSLMNVYRPHQSETNVNQAYNHQRNVFNTFKMGWQ